MIEFCVLASRFTMIIVGAGILARLLVPNRYESVAEKSQDEETDLPCDEILGPTMEISCVWPSIIFGAKGLPRSVSTARRKWINTSRAL